MWSHISCLRSPKEEPYVAADGDLSEIRDGFPMTNAAHKLDILGEFEDIFGTEDDETLAEHLSGDLEWGAMEWEQLPSEGLIEEDDKEMKIGESLDEFSDNFIIKRENLGFWEEKKSLALNLNYQEVLDAWSDRGPLWAHDTSLLTANHAYGGEVPIMEMEEERSRREARVLRYKEKRQSRLFSKKIRYQVRKINAENRPRLKGRFVKSIPENVMR